MGIADSGRQGISLQVWAPRVEVVNVAIVRFFFSSRRRHTRFDCDWSSDVCSSDLYLEGRNLWVRGVDIKRAEYEDTAADEFEILDLRRWSNCLQAARGVDQVYNQIGERRVGKECRSRWSPYH